jgi:hypothetical protein
VALLAASGAGHALDHAGAELLGRARDLPLDVVGEVGGERGSMPGSSPKTKPIAVPRAEAASPRASSAAARDHRQDRAELARIDLLDLLLEARQHLAYAEEADQNRHDVEALHQLQRAEVEPLRARERIGADGGEPHAEYAQHHARQDRAAGEAHQRRHGEQDQAEIFGGPEMQREVGDFRPQEGDGEGAQHAREVGADGGNGERLAGAALLRSWRSRPGR